MKRHARLAWLVFASLTIPAAAGFTDWLVRHLRHASLYAAGARALLRSLYSFLES